MTPSAMPAHESSNPEAQRRAASEPACAFCAEIGKHEALETLGTVVALADGYPVTEGHTLIVPRRHVELLFDLTDEELRDTWQLLVTLERRLREGDATISGFNVGVNIGAAAGQTIPHVHVHLIPRRPGDTPDPGGGVRGVVPARMSYAREAL